MNKSSVKEITAQALAHDYASEAVTEAEVREYILNNKDFFVKNPDVAERVQVPHKQKGTVSLVELQGSQLRKKVRQLSFKLSQLISIAKQNERIYRVYADLNMRLLRCTDFAEMQYTIEETLQDELDMSAATIKPFKGLFALP
jgi:uncharacterized protein YigA (DUF484 family)